MRKVYLQEHRPGLCNRLLLSEKLQTHLLEAYSAARHGLEVLLPKLAAGAAEAPSRPAGFALRGGILIDAMSKTAYNIPATRKEGVSMPKGSPELTQARKDEIINACEKLYQTMSFKDITIKEIGAATSFTRTSIYNYFQTKEEIFLALLQREYQLWVADLKDLMAREKTLSADGFADALARSLEQRRQLLKLMSMNHYDMEENSRPERLAEFKVAYGQALRTVEDCLKQYFPGMTGQDRQDFLYTFFPLMFGIYPYTVVTPKQKAAMEQAGVDYVYQSLYELSRSCIKKLLK